MPTQHDSRPLRVSLTGGMLSCLSIITHGGIIMDIQPFHIHVPEADLSELLDRLIQTRWPDEIPNTGWDYGTYLDYIKE